MRIAELSVRRPVFATVLSSLLVIFGIVSLQRLSVREYPDIDRPVVSVQTTYNGASAAIIETKITQVIEDAIAGIEGVLKIESESEDERSQVRIEFEVSREFPLVTLVTMVAPSPDWFVGVHDYDLVAGGDWVVERRVSLYPYDAGTDDGETYSSPDRPAQPPMPTALLGGAPVVHLGRVAPFGDFVFRRLR